MVQFWSKRRSGMYHIVTNTMSFSLLDKVIFHWTNNFNLIGTLRSVFLPERLEPAEQPF